jgi:hypothetical protein
MPCVRPHFLTTGVFDTCELYNFGALTKYTNSPLVKARSSFQTSSLQKVASQLAEEKVHLDFSVPFDWEIGAVSRHMAKWLVDTDGTSSFSAVGLISSREFRDMITHYVGPASGNALRLLVYLSSYLHVHQDTSSYRGQTKAEIQAVRDYAGREVLRFLDSTLKSTRIDTSSPEKERKWQAVFLILLGAIISIPYLCDEVCGCSF